MENDVYSINIKGINYIILDKIELNNTKYIYLVNENDEKDFFINKIVTKDNKEYITGLDSEEEAKNAMLAYVEKNANSE